VAIVLQHLIGIATALLLYATIRRLSGSPWPGLLPAAVVLLNSDQIYLEQNVMSESLFGLFAAGAFYAAVRAIEEPDPWWRSPLVTGVVTALATTVRVEALFLLPVMCPGAAVRCARGRGGGTWRRRSPRWARPAVLLLAYAGANDIANSRFEVGPATGWHLYGRVAPFADCGQFTPPKGTEPLCHPNPPGGHAVGERLVHLPAGSAGGPDLRLHRVARRQAEGVRDQGDRAPAAHLRQGDLQGRQDVLRAGHAA